MIRPTNKKTYLLLDGEWMVWVNTGSGEFMTTTGTVTLCAYGSKGTSEPVVLGSGKSGAYFQLGATDEFKVIMLYVVLRFYLLPFDISN